MEVVNECSVDSNCDLYGAVVCHVMNELHNNSSKTEQQTHISFVSQPYFYCTHIYPLMEDVCVGCETMYVCLGSGVEQSTRMRSVLAGFKCHLSGVIFLWEKSVLRCIVLCCVMLCCVVLCCAVLYCAIVLCCVVLLLCCVALYCCCVVLCCPVLCFVVLCCIVLCCVL